MGTSPLAVLTIVGIYSSIFGLAQGALGAEDVETYGLDTAPDITAPEGGLFDNIGAVFDTIGDVFAMVLGVLVFNVEGAPWWIRLIISVVIIGNLTWSLVELVRGN